MVYFLEGEDVRLCPFYLLQYLPQPMIKLQRVQRQLVLLIGQVEHIAANVAICEHVIAHYLDVETRLWLGFVRPRLLQSELVGERYIPVVLEVYGLFFVRPQLVVVVFSEDVEEDFAGD